jgi:hypothetical protein
MAMREKAQANFRVYRNPRSQNIAQHKGYRAPADSLHNLPKLFGLPGLFFLALCIVGIIAGSTGLAITAGILAVLLLGIYFVLSSD